MSHKRFDKAMRRYIKDLKKTLNMMDEGEVTVPDPGLRIRNALVKRGFSVLYRAPGGPHFTTGRVTISYA